MIKIRNNISKFSNIYMDLNYVFIAYCFCGYVCFMVDRAVKISNAFKAGGGGVYASSSSNCSGAWFCHFGKSPNILFLEIMGPSLLRHPEIVNRVKKKIKNL